MEGTVSVPRSPARQPGAVRRGAEHLKRPPRAVGRPAGADWFCRGAQLERNRAGGQGPDLSARGESCCRTVGWGRWQPVRRGAPSPQQVLDQETLAQVAEARRGGEVQQRGGSHHVPVGAGMGRHGAGEHGAAPRTAARPLPDPRPARRLPQRWSALSRERRREHRGRRRAGKDIIFWAGRFLKGGEE